MTTHTTLIGGAWVGSDSTVEVLNPADVRHVVGSVPALAGEQVELAYRSARAGFMEWSAMNPLTRSAVLARAADLLRERAEALAEVLVSENGKTAAEARGEVEKSADFFDYYSAMGRLSQGELLADGRLGTTVTVRREPLGVVLVITPWNDPLLTPCRKLAPALAAGNAVVLKPASETPLVALELARVLVDAGIPMQALQVVTGRARTIASALIASDEIDAITFTGSTEVGLELQDQVAGRNLRVQTEMGGKNAAIVLADADLDLAVATIVAAAFAQGGQRCTATSRILVERSIHQDFVGRLVRAAEAIRLGRPDETGTSLGPLISRSHQSDVLKRIEAATSDGAELRTGGGQPSGPGFENGCWVEPTILDGVEPTSTIWTEEVFGPVVAVLPVDSLDEAIALANESVYGLSASLFTTQLAATTTFLERIEAGQVAVNLPTSGWDVHHPFGGFKMSGSPFKEQGTEALNFYTRVKTCAVRAV